MKYFPLSLGPMQESGSALLRALQNESMIPLDLLVREAVQNSLDAARKPATDTVSIDVRIRPHETDTVANLFESGIDREVLTRRFPKGGCMLEIRDSETEGLTGPIRLKDVTSNKPRGNFLKLVYEVGRTHNDENAGGSWGLGKTCYFRVGIGLVLYYSRIQVDDLFEERLIACLVENESDETRLQRDSATGIAWWGIDEGAPLTEPTEVARVLQAINVQPYAGKETGTTIIIPFLRPDLTPQQDGAYSDEPDGQTNSEPPPWWFTTYANYVRISMERWFCARIDNPLFRGGPALMVSIDGHRLETRKMLPVFQVLQALYNRIEPSTDKPEEDYLDRCGVDENNIFNAPIDVHRVFKAGTNAGRIAAVRLTEEQLKMVVPENMPDPYRCIFDMQEHAQRDRPLVAFMRGPGMVIRWDNSADPQGWGGNTQLEAGKTFLIGLFVPDKDRELREDIQNKLRTHDQTLESYLRSCERADHHQWLDQANLTIISRIRSKAGSTIERFNSPTAANPSHVSLREARNIADKLLPSGFGQDGRTAPTTAGRTDERGPTRHQGDTPSSPDLEIRNVQYGEGDIKICWRLYWGKGRSSRNIQLGIDSESGLISYEKWSAEGLGAFPLSIETASINDETVSGNVDILTTSGTAVTINPWLKKMDGATLDGELTINISKEMTGSLRPVLHASSIQVTAKEQK